MIGDCESATVVARIVESRTFFAPRFHWSATGILSAPGFPTTCAEFGKPVGEPVIVLISGPSAYWSEMEPRTDCCKLVVVIFRFFVEILKRALRRWLAKTLPYSPWKTHLS